MNASAAHAVLRRALDRVTFGTSPELIEEAQRLGWERWLDAQLAPGDRQDVELERRLRKLKLLIEYETDQGPEGKMMMKGGKRKVKELRPLQFLNRSITRFILRLVENLHPELVKQLPPVLSRKSLNLRQRFENHGSYLHAKLCFGKPWPAGHTRRLKLWRDALQAARGPQS